MNGRFSFALALVTLTAACGGEASAPAAKAPEPVATQAAPKGPQMMVTQEMGSLDPAEVDRAVRKVERDLFRCQEKATDRYPYIHGTMKYALRLTIEGKPKWIHLEESTLGDHEAEVCMMHALEGAPWPKPIGGEGELKKSFGFTLGDAKPPRAWNADRIQEGLLKSDADLKKCHASTASSKYAVTLYIVHDDTPPEPPPPPPPPAGKKPSKPVAKTDKDKDAEKHPAGKVVTASAVSSDRKGDESVECLVGVLKQLRVPSPGEQGAAKVAFSL